MSDERIATGTEHVLSTSTLIELCKREIQAYHALEPSNETYGLELLHRAILQSDQEAWIGVQQCLSGTVLGWLHAHPHREVTCCWQSEEDSVELAFEKFRQAAVQGQVVFETLAEALVYLRASLNGAILETLRVCSRPKAVSERLSGERSREGHPEGLEVWGWLQARFSSERERRLAYLLYHCGLSPVEIVRCCPQEWRDVHEVARLRHSILERLLRK